MAGKFGNVVDEVTRPEWDVKQTYLNVYFEAVETYREYRTQVKIRGVGSPRLFATWSASLESLKWILWSKLVKEQSIYRHLLAMGTRLENANTPLLAMQEANVFFEKNGYTKVESERQAMETSMVDMK